MPVKPKGPKRRPSAALESRSHAAPVVGGRQWVRIIGGEWRGRRLSFPPVTALRPTPDRVRETLFNWLQGTIAGARCLDLFAGSGALGFEALSRGARETVFIETDRLITVALRESAAELKCSSARIIEADASTWLRGSPEAFDVIFLDPPYARDGLDELCTLLDSGGWLSEDGYVYLETAAQSVLPALPAGWEIVRQTRAGAVRGTLIHRSMLAQPTV